MRKIIKGRGEGKTAELIKMSHKTGYYIIVCTEARRKAICKQAIEMGLLIPYPVIFEEYQRYHFRGSFVRKILIDDADDMLRYIFKEVEIEAITMTGSSDIYDEGMGVCGY